LSAPSLEKKDKSLSEKDRPYIITYGGGWLLLINVGLKYLKKKEGLEQSDQTASYFLIK
jgi:hypothetical protein